MRQLKPVFYLIFFVVFCVSANDHALSQSVQYPPLILVDVPRAGTLPSGEISFDLQALPGGGVLTGISYGVLNNLYLNVSYGGSNVIGTGDIDWNPHVGFEIKFRMINESLALPGIAIGFISQGYGKFSDLVDRYNFKSKGFYLTASRNFSFWGDLGIHAGANYSIENTDGDKDPTLFIGIDKSFFNRHEIFAEYDFALNDNEGFAFGEKKGYLNAGIRFNIYENFALDVLVKDILENNDKISSGWRSIRLLYKMKIKKP